MINKEFFEELCNLYERDLAKDGRLNAGDQKIASEVFSGTLEAKLASMRDSLVQELSDTSFSVFSHGVHGCFHNVGRIKGTGHYLQEWKGPSSNITTYAGSVSHQYGFLFDDETYGPEFKARVWEEKIDEGLRLCLIFNDRHGDNRGNSYTSYTLLVPESEVSRVKPMIRSDPSILIDVFKRVFPDYDRSEGTLCLHDTDVYHEHVPEVKDPDEEKGNRLDELKEEAAAKGGSWLYAYDAAGYKLLNLKGYKDNMIFSSPSRSRVWNLSQEGLDYDLKLDWIEQESFKFAINEAVVYIGLLNDIERPLKAREVFKKGSDEPLVEIMYTAFIGRGVDGRPHHFIKGVTVPQSLSEKIIAEFKKHPDQVESWFRSVQEPDRAIYNGRILIASKQEVAKAVEDNSLFGEKDTPDAIKALEKEGLVYTYELS